MQSPISRQVGIARTPCWSLPSIPRDPKIVALPATQRSWSFGRFGTSRVTKWHSPASHCGVGTATIVHGTRIASQRRHAHCMSCHVLTDIHSALLKYRLSQHSGIRCAPANTALADSSAPISSLAGEMPNPVYPHLFRTTIRWVLWLSESSEPN